MRLHQLQITAFGPFGGTVDVDVDELSAAGLFLLSGATGAGKTSILDAVCFALYGDVPGDRSAARRLRSDQAAAGVAPQVTLEATLSGRRFRITRSPAWERPKKRGTGLTTQHASVRIAERLGGPGGTWRTIATRLDEAGHLVGDLVGLNLDQFCQVALLPQGRFQAFLRARSEDRHRLLQQLFRTGRFEDVESWLRERRGRLRKDSEAHQGTVADLVSRVSETADPAEPADRAAPPVDVVTWAARLVADAEHAHQRVAADQGAADRAAASAGADFEAARILADRQARHAAARAELSRLDGHEQRHREDVRRLEAAGRASRVVPLVALADAARADSARAAAAERTALAAITTRLGDHAPAAIVEARDRARAEAAAARALLPREEQLVGLIRTVETHTDRVAGLDLELAEHEAAIAGLPERLQEARTRHEAAVVAAAALPGAEARADGLHARAAAAARQELLAGELDRAGAALAFSVDEAHRLTERWLQVREQRLDGMAAEMAQSLVAGGGCPVCGSEHHPHPATVGADAPGVDAERAARKGVDDAEAERAARDGHVRDLTTRLALVEQLVGPRSGLAEDVTAADADVTRLRDLAGSEARLAAARLRLEAEGDALARRCEAARLERQGVVDARRATEARIGETRREIEAALRDTGDPDLATRAARLADLATACDTALTALERAEQAAAHAARNQETLADAVASAGFEDAGEASAAALDPSEHQTRSQRVRAHEAARLASQQVVDDPTLAEAAAAPSPDLESLRAIARSTSEEAARAGASARVAATRHERLQDLYRDLTEAMDAWAPVRADLDLTTALSAFVDGRSPDNRLQMRLSAYVLAYRLGQVVEAANERLTRMSDRRYSLVHTAQRGAGENRGGLSLQVRDDWSGESRDPATLSGGETFVVSLALALGLADVITQESDSGSRGDARLDTLFVDEGFGSLDADTLDDVMDVLDSLREGGRVVGVVSHVAELRDRIPVRLEVVKSRHGSTVQTPQGSGSNA